MIEKCIVDTPALQVSCNSLASLVLIGAWPNQIDLLKKHLHRAFIALPNIQEQIATEIGDLTLYPVHPCKFLISNSNETNLFTHLGKGFSTEIGSLSDQSHGRMMFSVVGKQASGLLARGLPLDPVHHLPHDGSFVQTRMHDTNVLVHRKRDDQYLMLVPTSFAVSVSDWMHSAQ